MENYMFQPLLAIFGFSLKFDLGSKILYVMRVHLCLDEEISTSILYSVAYDF
jgi:hypothetical protein